MTPSTGIEDYGPDFHVEGAERSAPARSHSLSQVFFLVVNLAATTFATICHAGYQERTVPQESQEASQEELLGFPGGYTGPIPVSLVGDGWIALFDSETLYGWRAESEANWRVEDACICVDSGEQGLLRTTSQFDDFELRFEFSANESTNSGVFIRTSPKPVDPATDCCEINIAPRNNPFPTGSIVARERIAAGQEIATSAAEFHLMEITCCGEMVSVKLDGRPVIEYRDGSPLGRGYIGLQLNSGAIRFRNIWLRPNWSSNVMKQNLSEWRTGGGAQTTIPQNGSLQLTGGPGYLESPGQFGDFVLQVQCKIASGQNSGVFYRCIPGENQNGYESQIDNGWQSDRSKPTNSGTGAIFRRTEARRIVADDEQWFAKTIVATGPHVSVWVNGYQVTDWSDQREADPNPRKGLRIEPGTLMLQAHDEATDVSFREVWIDELSPRNRMPDPVPTPKIGVPRPVGIR